jgi:hypothetical protein
MYNLAIYINNSISWYLQFAWVNAGITARESMGVRYGALFVLLVRLVAEIESNLFRA